MCARGKYEKIKLFHRAVNVLCVLKSSAKLLLAGLRFIVIGCVYWCASEGMHAAQFFWPLLEVLTEDLIVSPARKKQNHMARHA